MREYVWLGEIPVAVMTPASAVGGAVNVFFIHADHLNTPRAVMSAAGQLRWRWLSDAFGVAPPEENPAGLGAFALPLRMPGQYFDVETGLFQNYRRDYDPTLGRYIESDPIGLEGGLNTYAYVDNDPILGTDPQGLAKPQKHDPNGSNCRDLRKKMAEHRKDLDERWEELRINHQGLRLRVSPTERLRESIRGHRTKINTIDSLLRTAEKKYRDECGDDDPPAPPAPAAGAPMCDPSPARGQLRFNNPFKGLLSSSPPMVYDPLTEREVPAAPSSTANTSTPPLWLRFALP